MYLSTENRQFFKTVLDAALANPFSEKRDSADNSILGISGNVAQKRLPDVIQEVKKRLSEIKNTSSWSFKKYEDPDRRILLATSLFLVFHKSMEYFDAHIVTQKTSPKTSRKFSHAQEVIQDLESLGFSRDESIRHIGLFFQLRRTFFMLTEEIIGESTSIISLRKKVWNNLYSHNMEWYLEYLLDSMQGFSTLILGETGVGKTSIARVIGCSGFIPYNPETQEFEHNFMDIFRSINISEYPPSLVESALFGHKKGAFTSAIEDRSGFFDLSNRYGAIFIDELGETTSDIQVKLLNVLQDRTFSPVGSNQIKEFNGRVIAATNQNIHDLVREGKFREDLYYRLCSDIIEIPPLRIRVQENPDELDIILEQIVKRVVPHLSQNLLSMIQNQLDKYVGKDYHWPGNIRELEQAIRRICLSGSYRPADLQRETLDVFSGQPTAKSILESYANHLYLKHGTYEKVSKIMDMDPRTVKKYLQD